MIISYKPKLKQMLAAQRIESQNNFNLLPTIFKTDLEKNEKFLKMLHTFGFTMNDIVRNCKVQVGAQD